MAAPILNLNNAKLQSALPDMSGLDSKTASHVRLLWDRVNSLQGRAGDTIQQFATVSTNGNNITNVADPVNPQDAVTLSYAQKHFGAAATRTALSIGGTNPLNLTGLPGGSLGLVVGTHADRTSTYPTPTPGQTFYETDRNALYAGINTSWILVGSCPEMLVGGISDLPTDLGGNDLNFYAFDTTTGLTWSWDGALWHWHKGIQYGVFASRPTAFSGCDAGVIYVATDRGHQAWELDFGTGTWVLLQGWGGPTSGTIAGITGSLTADDVGYRYYATDFDREYTWGGASYHDSPGMPARGMICYFNAAAPTGWAYCDGSSTTTSTSSGGTTGLTTPSIFGNFIQAGSSGGFTGTVVNISYQTGGTVLSAVAYITELAFIRL